MKYVLFFAVAYTMFFAIGCVDADGFTGVRQIIGDYPDQSLIAYFPFDGHRDDVIGGRYARLHRSEFGKGSRGQNQEALKLRTDSYVEFDDPDHFDFAADSNFAISFWFLPDPEILSTSEDIIARTILKKGSQSANYWIFYRKNLQDTALVTLFAGRLVDLSNERPEHCSVLPLQFTTYPLPASKLGVYHHLLFQQRDIEQLLYIDGELVDVVPAIQFTDCGLENERPLRIGSEPGMANGMVGNFDELRIYRSAFSDETASRLINR